MVSGHRRRLAALRLGREMTDDEAVVLMANSDSRQEKPAARHFYDACTFCGFCQVRIMQGYRAKSVLVRMKNNDKIVL